MASQSTENLYFNITPQSFYGDYNQLNTVIQKILETVQTATLVKVVSCTNNGGVEAVGFVDVNPLVNQIDGNGNSYVHGTVHNIPYLRIQGGANAIIIDPQVGDIGICVFANRDLSSVKETKTNSAPGSLRKFSYSDGLYLGGVLNGTPENYIQFNEETVTIKSTTIVLDGDVTVSGTLSAQGEISSDDDVKTGSISLKNHVHSGVTSGGDNTGAPVG